MRNIAIVGGGPAGAFAGELLAEAGFRVTILDEKLAWEKPCGGGLTAKALEQYPFLANGDAPKRFVDQAVLVASNGARTSLRLRRPLAIYSRQVLNGLLLDRACRSGASLIRDRVLSAEAHGGAWQLRGKQGGYAAEFCVIAAGARNPLRQLGTELGPQDAYVASATTHRDSRTTSRSSSWGGWKVIFGSFPARIIFPSGSAERLLRRAHPGFGGFWKTTCETEACHSPGRNSTVTFCLR